MELLHSAAHFKLHFDYMQLVLLWMA